MFTRLINPGEFLGAAVLPTLVVALLVSCDTNGEAPNHPAPVKAGFDTPQEAFQAYTAAADKFDIRKAFPCLTEASSDHIAGEAVLIELRRLRETGDQVDKEEQEKIRAVFQRHGINVETFEDTLPKDNDTYKRVLERETKAGSLLKNKTELLAELAEIRYAKHLANPPKLPKKQLENLRVNGDIATGVAVWKKGEDLRTDPIYFRRIHGRWFVHIPRSKDEVPDQLAKDLERITEEKLRASGQPVDRGSRDPRDPAADPFDKRAPSNTDRKPPAIRIAFVPGLGSLNAARGAVVAGKELGIGVAVIVPDWRGDFDKAQQDVLRELIDSDFDGVILHPTDASGQSVLVKQLASQMKVVTVLDDRLKDVRHAHVGVDPIEFGRVCGELLTQALPKGGRVMVVSSEFGEAAKWRKGFVDAARGLERKTSNEKQSSNKFEFYEPPLLRGVDALKTVDVVREELRRDDDIDAVVGLSPLYATALPHIRVRDRKVPIISMATDEDADALSPIAEGGAYGLVAEDLFGTGYEAVWTMYTLVAAKHGVPKDILVIVKPRIVTKENVKEVKSAWERIAEMDNPLEQRRAAHATDSNRPDPLRGDPEDFRPGSRDIGPGHDERGPSEDGPAGEPTEDPERPEATSRPAKTSNSKPQQINRLLEVTIADVVQIYKATNGEAPESLDEFMTEVIEEYGLKLPELPKGKRYDWNPKTEQLSIENDRLTP